MRKLVIVSSLAAMLSVGFAAEANSANYVEYYRDNLFIGLAYHRVACLTDWNTVQTDQDYDGFTNKRYCYTGANSASVPDGQWYDWNHAKDKAQLDSCGQQANSKYGTPNYASSSNSCNYNILFDCNSDCWIRKFSSCQGKKVSIASPCW
ncbi:hypothetical protein G6O69_17600 [Pseudenhygromyxa sp. WMMC2535]|uniref:hypothetical protein n=1 Tax=Pseudenhygromyxa sp. WMMC2535 TaxID=2712867 RepID=UPI001553D6B0|nr:hypothetical protein [Pseudenhygromyxa sp. WMMC2535]NVB39662.1 hypothetical protein [Pseudenhygromyxa sp. WMMC2535]